MSISLIGANQTHPYNASTSASGVTGVDSDGDHDGSRSKSSQSDSVTISAQGSTLLQSSQSGGVQGVGHGHGHHHHPKLTDDQAAKVGADIQKKNPGLFKQQDQDGDGKLTAAELKSGIDKLRQEQGQSGTQSAPAAGQTSASPLDLIRQSIRDVLNSSQTQGTSTTSGQI